MNPASSAVSSRSRRRGVSWISRPGVSESVMARTIAGGRRVAARAGLHYSLAVFARSRQLFATGMFAVDAALIAGSWLGAYYLRFFGLGLEAPLGVPPLSLYL